MFVAAEDHDLDDIEEKAEAGEKLRETIEQFGGQDCEILQLWYDDDAENPLLASHHVVTKTDRGEIKFLRIWPGTETMQALREEEETIENLDVKDWSVSVDESVHASDLVGSGNDRTREERRTETERETRT